MDRETIEKAANEKYADNTFAYKGFITGAEWRINAAWHGLDELPVPDKTVIVEYVIDGHAEYVFTHLSENANVVTDEYGFCFYVDGGKITRWAYISDLLPERKEETK